MSYVLFFLVIYDNKLSYKERKSTSMMTITIAKVQFCLHKRKKKKKDNRS